ncbi:MAG: hypothetical protein ACKVWV_03355 [Planctomycetota bacterium]
MERIIRIAALGLALCTLGLAHAQSSDAGRYLRVANGARLFNLPDKASVAISTPPANTLLAVYGERAGYLEVEPASGLQAWVFGQYVKPTEVPGILEVTGEPVLMRPLPASDEKSFPLSVRLHRGDRVRALARANPSKAASEDFVQIQAPPGTRAWIVAGETAPLAAGEDGRALWTSAVNAAQAKIPTVDLVALGFTAKAASAPKITGADASAQPAAAPAQNSEAARVTLDQAEKLFADAKAAPTPDFAKAKAAYQSVLQQSSTGTAAETARGRLDEIAAREEIVRLRTAAAGAEERRKEELVKADARLREASVDSDPLWGRFDARGWLERDPASTKAQPRYLVRWSGAVTAEVICTSGRFDLADFDQYEVGVNGTLLRSALPSADGQTTAPKRIDASRLEVITGRRADR